MRLQISKTKNASSLYIVKSTYDRNGKHSNKIVEKLGTLAELSKIYDDPIAWGKQRAVELTLAEKESRQRITVEYNPVNRIEKDKVNTYYGGYLFLQKLYYEYGLDKICKEISSRRKFNFDLNEILSCLIYGRILFPSSKANTFEECKNLLEKPNMELQHIYRALEALAEENEYLQAQLYKNSIAVSKRNDSILYYDCTNFFFEIEEESGIRQYGLNKEHRPNPIVEMGLFMDGDGIPLAFSIHPGNTNEQTTLKPLEKQIISEFGKSKFVVCTDAGLSSEENRRFNAIQNRAFITTQSIKKMKQYQKEWALSDDGWMMQGDNLKHTLQEIKNNAEKYENVIFYKETYFIENDFEQRYIVTFSLKYRNYLSSIREKQVLRAQKAIENNRVNKKRQNSPNMYIQEYHYTDNGEYAEHTACAIDDEKIEAEAMYDGFYCVATNLEDDIQTILQVNKNRWEIEESFRIMKSEFKARPVFLSRDDRIKAHFITCFLALFLFRNLEKRIDENYTAHEIINTLQNMTFTEVPREGYIPTYKRTNITDSLHEAFGFCTDYEFMSLSNFRKIFKLTKKA